MYRQEKNLIPATKSGLIMGLIPAREGRRPEAKHSAGRDAASPAGWLRKPLSGRSGRDRGALRPRCHRLKAGNRRRRPAGDGVKSPRRALLKRLVSDYPVGDFKGARHPFASHAKDGKRRTEASPGPTWARERWRLSLSAHPQLLRRKPESIDDPSFCLEEGIYEAGGRQGPPRRRCDPAINSRRCAPRPRRRPCRRRRCS